MNETLRTIAGLRSIHGDFSDREISSEDVEEILDASIQAATASARQSYSIIVISDKEIMKKLCGYSGSRLLLYCVDYTRLSDVAHHMGHKFDRKDLMGLIVGSTDTILAAQTAVIAAKSMGIDSLFTNQIHRGTPNRVYELLDLPREECFPMIALVLGYSSVKAINKKTRVTEGLIHYDKYTRLNAEQMDKLILKYDNPTLQLTLSDDWKKNFDHYLDWFYLKWSSKSDTREIEQLLEDTGFLRRRT